MAGGDGQRRRAAWRRVARAGWAAQRAGGPAGLAAAPALSVPPQGKGAGPLAAPSAVCGPRVPQPAPCGRQPGTGRPLTFHAGSFCVCSGVFGVESQPGDKQDQIS